MIGQDHCLEHGDGNALAGHGARAARFGEHIDLARRVNLCIERL